MTKRFVCIFLCLIISGCSNSHIYRKKVGIGLDSTQEYNKKFYTLTPIQQQKEEEGILVSVEYIPKESLQDIFLDKKIYGIYAGKSPYPDGTTVVRVRVENKTESRVLIDPDNFVLLDELGTQYLYISPESIKEIYESKSLIYDFMRSKSLPASGIYGTALGTAQGSGGRGVNKKFVLLKSVELRGGYIYPGVSSEGYLCFLNPDPKAKNIKLIISNVKTSFDVNDEALGRVDFKFDFKNE